MEKYMIVAKCDPYNAKKHYNGQKVLRYDGSTPVEWVAADGMTMREAKDTLYDWCLNECDDLFNFNEHQAVLDWCRSWLDDGETDPVLNMLSAIDENGYGIYNQADCSFFMGVDDEAYTFDVMTYEICKEDDYSLRPDTQIYKEIYKEGGVTAKEKAIIDAVNGEEAPARWDKVRELHAFALAYSQEYNVGEALVELLNELQVAENKECSWYLGDIHEEYVNK